jgi:acetyl-CoA carboxylase biotin carboxyl carrier protein
MTVEPDAQVPDSVTHREIQEILRTFAASGWSTLELEVRGMRIVVGKDGPPVAATTAPATGAATARTAAVPAPAPVTAREGTPGPAAVAPAPAAPAVQAAPLDTEGLVAVRSPAVGAFWVAPAPGQPAFVEVGQVVARDEQLAIVEVMKLMNPVVAPQPGEIVQVCAGNAELVEYDQVLFLIRPSDG